MFDVNQIYAMNHIIILFNRYQNDFPFEQRREVEGILHELSLLDSVVKDIRKDKEAILGRIDEEDPELADNFLEACHELLTKIIEALELEKEELSHFKEFFKKDDMEETVSSEKAIELEENLEEEYSERMLFWLERFKKAIAKVYKDTKYAHLKEIQSSIKKLIKFVKKLELDIEIERQHIRKQERDQLRQEMDATLHTDHVSRLNRMGLYHEVSEHKSRAGQHRELKKLMVDRINKW